MSNPFDDLVPGQPSGGPMAANPFDDLVPSQPIADTSASGAFGRSAAMGAVPAAGGLVGAGFGAAKGAALGALVPGLGETGLSELAGGVIGGLAGAFGGSYVAGKGQDYAIKQLPDTWQSQIEKQQRADEAAHPYASFIGGNVPYLMTMSPFGAAKAGAAALPETASTLQRLMANPLTGRAFGGALMGGMELGQEYAQGDVNWSKVAISTGLGVVFNHTNRVGEALSGFGESAAHGFRARPATVAQANEANIIGPGVNEDVALGVHQRDESSEQIAQEQARQEATALGAEPPAPDLHELARRLEPETFARYDELTSQRDAIRSHIDAMSYPPDEQIGEAQARKDEADEALRAHLEDRGGYKAGPEARRLRANSRAIQSEIDEMNARRAAHEAGEGVETEEMGQLRQHLMAIDEQLRDTGRDVAAAYRRAAERAGGETVEAASEPVAEAAPAPPETSAKPGETAPERPISAPPEAAPEPRDAAEQRAWIAKDLMRRLMATGLGREEAEANAAVTSEFYATMARRMGMNRADLFYVNEHPDVKGKDGRIIRAGTPPGGLGTGRRAPRAAERGEEPVARAPEPTPASAPEKTPVERMVERQQAQDTARRAQLEDMAKSDDLQKLRKSHENLVQELRGNKPLPDGFTVKAPAEGETGFTVLSPDGEIVGKGATEAAARNDFFNQKSAKDEAKAGEKELQQKAFGSIRIRPGQRSIITLAKTANASTFMHETAHDWLEKMLDFGAREAAPQDVRADAATIRRWLGMSEEAGPTRGQHEKFARGFEQYLREGRAPSTRLARVFEKFKGWLTQIYRTLKGLGAPISDDIRGVFDRMLAVEPGERTVIAPEAEAPKDIHAIHEADAREVEPQEAEPAARRVDAEREEAVEQTPPEAQQEHVVADEQSRPEQEAGSEPGAGGTDAGAIAGEGEGRSGEVEPDRGASGAKPAGGGERGGSRPKRESKRAPVGEGDGASQGEPGTEKGPNAPLAPRPNELLGPVESPVIDKAGNIRLDNLNTTEDVAEAIRQAANENDNFIGDRRGIVTDAQVEMLAEALGMSPDALMRRKVGQAFNAEQVWAARNLLRQSARAVSDAMKAVAAGGENAVVQYAMAKDRHRMIQAQVSGITAEAGRALRAFRAMPGDEGTAAIDQFIKKATGKTLFQLEEEAKLGAQLDTPEQVSKFVADASKRTFGRMVLEYWINGLISGPATHTTYMIGNLVLALEKAGPETALAAGIGRARAAMGRAGETVQAGEVGAQLRALGRSVVPALRASVESLREGQTALLPGEKPSGVSAPLQPGAQQMGRFTYDENAGLKDLHASTFGMIRGMRDGFLAGGKLLAAGGQKGEPILGARYSNLGLIPDITIRGVNALPIGSAVRLPSRFIAAIHSMFRGMNYSMEKAALAYRQAASEGLEGAAFDKRVGELRQAPTDDMMEQARSEATTLTLMGRGSEFTQALSRLTNTEVLGFPILKFIDPFVHIASNVIDQSIIQRTPIGLLSPELRADIMGKNGNVAQDKAMARMMAGTALAITFGGLAAQGYVSGSGPKDPRQQAMWRLAGNQPHSVRIADTWYDVHRLGPMGMLLGMAADLYDIAHTAEKGEFATAAAEFQHALTQNILDESFMRGPAELIQAIEDPGRYGEAYLRNFVSSFVPYSVGMGQIDRATDPYTRRAKTVLDAVRAKVPGLSESLMPKRDIWGEPIPNLDALGAAGLTAIYERHVSTDPVNLEMVRLGLAPAQLEAKVRNVKLTDEQYDDFSRLAGRMAKRNLDRIVQAPEFQSWPNHIRVDVINETIKQAREAARGMMMMKYPQIARDALAQKRQSQTDERNPLE